MESTNHTPKKEVACKALLPLLIAVEKKKIDFSAALRDVPYPLSYLRDKHERIEWRYYSKIADNIRPFFSPADFETMGVEQIREKRFAEIVVAGFFLFATGPLARLLTNQAFRVGRQLFNCVDYGTEYVAPNRVKITLTMSPGYDPTPEFFLITKGSWYQVGQLVRKGFKLNLFWTDRGAIYDMSWEKEGILFKIKRRLRWLFYVRKALTDLDVANVTLLRQYDELVQSKKTLEQQSTRLKTAHEITKSIRQSLEIRSTLEAITTALVREAKFSSASLRLFKDVEGNDIHFESVSGEHIGDGRLVSRFIDIDGKTIGELKISPGKDVDAYELNELLAYLIPIISVSIHDSLVLRVVTDYRNNLELKVDQRTSELKKAENELSKTVSLLRAAREAQNHFFANISHQFRTPLTLIEGPLQLLRSGEYKGDPAEQYDLVLRNSRHMLQLVNQLLDLAKVESGEMKRHMCKQDLAAVVRWIAAAFESAAKRKEITFVIEGADEPLLAWVDRDAVEKIMTNLLSNAFKFTPDRGEVRIQVRHVVSDMRNEVEISVADTGLGIPPEEIDKVFDRFYQVDASHTREFGGTGIGLALSKELAELQHGGIRVVSEVGKGSRFTVWFPIGRDNLRPDEIATDIEAETPVSRPPALDETESRSINEKCELDCYGETPVLLIVEDNADMRQYIRASLNHGYRILESSDGASAVEQAIEEIPDLIISDVMMPNMDGHELCRVLKHNEKTSHIPIILLTAKAGIEDRLEGLETGADDYLVKPFDPNELMVRVRNLIGLRQTLREKFEKKKVLKPGEIVVTSMDDVFLQKAMAVVEKFMGDERFTVGQFSREMNMGRVQLYRKMIALTGQCPRDFVRYLRLHRGMDLLKKGAGTVSEVAYSVGFNSPAYFTKCFHEQFGSLPSDINGRSRLHTPS